jgi:hypothetical protein
MSADNYPVPDPNNPGAMMPRYPVESATHGQPTASAHAYLDWIEGCFAEAAERIGAVELRLRTLEAAHADLNVAFHRRATEFESRLDALQLSQNQTRREDFKRQL